MKIKGYPSKQKYNIKVYDENNQPIETIRRKVYSFALGNFVFRTVQYKNKAYYLRSDDNYDLSDPFRVVETNLYIEVDKPFKEEE